jgi:F420-non-reducing hydrogenase iron-sulfur subunit
VRQILEEIGLEGRRIQMINISSAMGGQFAFAAAEMTAEIKQLGPSPLRSAGELDPESKTVSVTPTDAL